jgi:hypothetical protein
MKIYKTVERHILVETHQELDTLACDICGNNFDIGFSDELEVRYKAVTSYGDGGCSEEIEIDICPECFKEKLIPWVESFGVTEIKIVNDSW